MEINFGEFQQRRRYWKGIGEFEELLELGEQVLENKDGLGSFDGYYYFWVIVSLVIVRVSVFSIGCCSGEGQLMDL